MKFLLPMCIDKQGSSYTALYNRLVIPSEHRLYGDDSPLCGNQDSLCRHRTEPAHRYIPLASALNLASGADPL